MLCHLQATLRAALSFTAQCVIAQCVVVETDDGLVMLGLVVRHRSSSRRTASDDRPIQIDRALAGSNSAVNAIMCRITSVLQVTSNRSDYDDERRE